MMRVYRIADQGTMRKSVTKVLLSSTVLVVSSLTLAGQQTLPQFDSSTERIKTASAQQDQQSRLVVVFGTAFFYNDSGDMFTNRHVIDNCDPKTIKVRIENGRLLPANVIAKSDRYDLAALSTKYHTDVFGAIRVTGDGHTLIPDGIEDIFSAGFSSPLEREFKITATWGQIEPWLKPNEPPYLQRMRMDAYPGASGSAVLDYAGLVVGILFAGSKTMVADPEKLRSIGYGDRWIYLYDSNAIVSFANERKLRLSAWSHWQRQDPGFIMSHAKAISGLVICEGHESGRSVDDRATDQ
ncbi:S1 family peptidase [Paraburkholderia sp. MM6662-R1]|uniref:S1 family peptidase n=1 Tax=Paraburkholderia sp. MM6662-R1 TaxID=2991066 RepID=UPI003D2265E1